MIIIVKGMNNFFVNFISYHGTLSFFSIPSTTALPVPVVTIVPDGAPIIGKNFTLNCSVTFDRTIAMVIGLQWLINGSSTYQDGVSISLNSDDSSTLTVNSVNVSDEGTYKCVATLDIAGLEVPRNSSGNAKYIFSILGKMNDKHFCHSPKLIV